MSKVQSYCVEHRIIKSSPRLSNHNIWHILSFTVTVKLFTNNCGAVTWIQHCCCYRGASFLSRTASLSSHIQVVTLLPPSPSPIHVFSLSSGWVCAGLLQTRALCHPAPSHNHPHHLSPLSLSTYFPLFSPSCAVLCDLLKPGRHVITLLDTKNSRQPVFSEEKEENEQGKQSDTSSRLLGHSV